MLFDIKQILVERQQMSLVDLANHFYVSQGIMQGMLTHWQKKGRIELVDASGACGTGCGSCSESQQSKIYYRWKDVPEKPIYAKID